MTSPVRFPVEPRPCLRGDAPRPSLLVPIAKQRSALEPVYPSELLRYLIIGELVDRDALAGDPLEAVDVLVVDEDRRSREVLWLGVTRFEDFRHVVDGPGTDFRLRVQ